MADEPIVVVAPEVTPPVVPPVVPPVANSPWHVGLDSETLGHIQNRGWDKLEPKDAAAAAVKAHREAEKLMGVPADKLLRMPDPTDAAAVKSFWQRLGAPATAEEYKFDSLKFADEKPASPEFQAFARRLASENNLPADVATNIAKGMVGYLDQSTATEVAEKAAALTTEKATLAANWGANKDANLFVAQQAAAKLGVSPEAITALEGVVGYAATMEMFRKIGAATGEDTFIGNPNPAIPGVMTRDQAVARKAELMADADWVKKYTDGGMASKEFKEMQALIGVIVGQAA